jgi:hypothetical protein
MLKGMAICVLALAVTASSASAGNGTQKCVKWAGTVCLVWALGSPHPADAKKHLDGAKVIMADPARRAANDRNKKLLDPRKGKPTYTRDRRSSVKPSKSTRQQMSRKNSGRPSHKRR